MLGRYGANDYRRRQMSTSGFSALRGDINCPALAARPTAAFFDERVKAEEKDHNCLSLVQETKNQM